MTARGGSIEYVNINNRLFPVAADADSERDLGGFTAEVMPNGDGSARKKKTRKPWRIEGLTVQIDNDRQDIEYLQSIADNEGWVPMGVLLVDGYTYGGQGTVVDEIKASSDNATAEIVLSGPHRLEQQ